MRLRLIFTAFLVLGFLPIGLGQATAQEAQPEGEIMDEGKHKITFEPFQISLLERGKLRGTVDIQLVLQLQENTDYKNLNALKPQLTADIAAGLSSLARLRWSVNRPIDPDIVSNYLTPIVARRVGAGKLDVYVLKALINPK